MSGLVVVNAGEEDVINAYLTLVALGGGHRLRLYTNDVTAGLTPDQIDVLAAGAFTEATFPGYVNVVVNGGWTFAQGNPTVAKNTLRQFTRSSTGTPQSIRGYYVTKVDTGALAWFEAFAAPIVMEFAADRIDITPQLTLDDAEGNAVEPGTITATARAAAPTGWLLCDGAAVSRTTFAALFAAIGTAYGIGDGANTFNLPDLRQRFPLGKAAAGTGATLGGTGGAIDHLHNLDTASAHARVSTATGNLEIQGKALAAWTSNARAGGSSVVANSNPAGAALAGNTAAANPPYQVVNYQIKT